MDSVVEDIMDDGAELWFRPDLSRLKELERSSSECLLNVRIYIDRFW